MLDTMPFRKTCARSFPLIRLRRKEQLPLLGVNRTTLRPPNLARPDSSLAAAIGKKEPDGTIWLRFGLESVDDWIFWFTHATGIFEAGAKIGRVSVNVAKTTTYFTQVRNLTKGLQADADRQNIRRSHFGDSRNYGTMSIH